MTKSRTFYIINNIETILEMIINTYIVSTYYQISSHFELICIQPQLSLWNQACGLLFIILPNGAC